MRAGIALAILIGTTWTAMANDGFNIVIPGRAGVPIVINGIDASYAVVEGDWGLAKSIQPNPTVYGGRYLEPVPNVGHYYPSAGHMPGYGRLEIEPPANRKLPQPAESYHQSWTAQSAPPQAQQEVPFYPPPVIFAQPQMSGGQMGGGDTGMPQDPTNPPEERRHRKHRKFHHHH